MVGIDKTNSPDEVLDLVNDNDEIIGQVLKGEANSDSQLIHREIAVLIYDDQNNLLFQQRSFKKKFGPGFWSISVAGHVPKSMEPIKAALMELEEELGFTVPLRFLKKEKLNFPNETHFVYCYLGKYSGEKIMIEPAEVEQVKFLSKEGFDKFLHENTNWDELSLGMAKEFWSGKILV